MVRNLVFALVLPTAAAAAVLLLINPGDLWWFLAMLLLGVYAVAVWITFFVSILRRAEKINRPDLPN